MLDSSPRVGRRQTPCRVRTLRFQLRRRFGGPRRVNRHPGVILLTEHLEPRGIVAEQSRMLIGPAWVSRAETIEIRNAFDGRPVDSVPRGTAADVQLAIEAAQAALAAS